MRSRRHVLVTVLVAVTVALVGSAAGCVPPPDTYVALGDSFTAGPLIPDQTLDPAGCLRSTRNYPNVARPSIRVNRFVDVSCSGARTTHLRNPQDVTPGPNPPQLDALDGRTKVVTIGIGGNDIGFTGIVQECALQNPFGRGCQADYVHDGRDEISERIAAAAPDVAQAIADVEARATKATVFVVGYPAILPDSGSGCYPRVPILPVDVPYLRAKTKELNGMLRAQALAAGVHFVDVYTPSIGHDACAGSSTRWVEGLVPTNPAAPVHPNQTGMQGIGAAVAAAVGAVVTQ
jgi:lysophospholipase L1-like esterase